MHLDVAVRVARWIDPVLRPQPALLHLSNVNKMWRNACQYRLAEENTNSEAFFRALYGLFHSCSDLKLLFTIVRLYERLLEGHDFVLMLFWLLPLGSLSALTYLYDKHLLPRYEKDVLTRVIAKTCLSGSESPEIHQVMLNGNLAVLSWLEQEATNLVKERPWWLEDTFKRCCVVPIPKSLLMFAAAHRENMTLPIQQAMIKQGCARGNIQLIPLLKCEACKTLDVSYFLPTIQGAAEQGRTDVLLCYEAAFGTKMLRNIIRGARLRSPLGHSCAERGYPALVLAAGFGHVDTALVFWRIRCGIPPEEAYRTPKMHVNKNIFRICMCCNNVDAAAWFLKNYEHNQIIRKDDAAFK